VGSAFLFPANISLFVTLPSITPQLLQFCDCLQISRRQDLASLLKTNDSPSPPDEPDLRCIRDGTSFFIDESDAM